MKKLIMVTDGFPWAAPEVPFIKNELEALAKEFDVEIVARLKPKYKDNPLQIAIPENIKLHKYIIDDITGKEKLKALGYALSKKAFYNELFRLIRIDRRPCVLKEMYAYITSTCQFMRWMKKNVDIDKADIFYTYWNSYATLGLAFEKNKKDNFKLVTRTHGYDLYNERMIYNNQYFKRYVDKKLDKVFFIAHHGKKYYLEHFAVSKETEKYVTNMIGVISAKSIPEKDNDVFRLVSCSSVIEIKRVDMIAKALSKIENINLEWIHFGSGDLMPQLASLCENILESKENISYELKGRVDNTIVREYYDTHYIDCFISTSSTEGSPVSVQEAMAYGMPVIGTNVGDVPFLTEGNGIILREDTTVEEVTDAIRQMCTMSKEEKSKLRKNAYAKWESIYDVKKNAEQFVSILKSL